MDKNLRIIAYTAIAILVINIILFALGITGPLIFWSVIAGIGYFAYRRLPKMAER